MTSMIGKLVKFFATKWIDNKHIILLSNHHNPRVARDIDRLVKGLNDKIKVSWPNIIYDYNQYMGGNDLSDHMKVSYQVDRRNKFRFYLRSFLDFLNIKMIFSI